MNKRYRLLPVVLAFAGIAAACGSAYDREEFISELVTESGVTEAQATCMADGMEDQIGVDRLNDRGNPTAEEESLMGDIALECVLGS